MSSFIICYYNHILRGIVAGVVLSCNVFVWQLQSKSLIWSDTGVLGWPQRRLGSFGFRLIVVDRKVFGMVAIFGRLRLQALFFLLILAGSLSAGDDGLDRSRYIGVDEIKPGMEAYCLTVYKGNEIEKFDLEVLSVVHDYQVGRDAILVQGTDERFVHSGPVAGCSGSPVYIEGRLAGALAFGWTFSKDPLYGVTPIEEMLRVGSGGNSENLKERGGFAFDYSVPIDFAAIDRQVAEGLVSGRVFGSRNNSKLGAKSWSGITTLPCPLVTSGLPAEVCEQLNSFVEPFGLMAVGGIGGGVDVESVDSVALVPGGILAIPLVTGDISMAVIGTVTEVAGDKVYGFGHSFLGYGPVEMPMATGRIHTVVSNVVRSFKFGTAGKIVGMISADESAAVSGRLGGKARMIPLRIKIDRYNDVANRVYNCEVVANRLFTGSVVKASVLGAVFQAGDLGPENMIEYDVRIGVLGSEPIVFKNVSTQLGPGELISESIGAILLLLNNPYKEVEITGLDFDISIKAKNIISHIWSADLLASTVKAGGQVDIDVIVESVLAGKKKYDFCLKVPDSLSAGRYELIVCGGLGYEQFLREAAAYRFVPENFDSLVDIINRILAVRRDRLYCILVLPSGGVTVEGAELADLPGTKALVLGDKKRTLQVLPYRHWVEKSFPVGDVVIDRKVMSVLVVDNP